MTLRRQSSVPAGVRRTISRRALRLVLPQDRVGADTHEAATGAGVVQRESIATFRRWLAPRGAVAMRGIPDATYDCVSFEIKDHSTFRSPTYVLGRVARVSPGCRAGARSAINRSIGLGARSPVAPRSRRGRPRRVPVITRRRPFGPESVKDTPWWRMRALQHAVSASSRGARRTWYCDETGSRPVCLRRNDMRRRPVGALAAVASVDACARIGRAATRAPRSRSR